MICANCFSCLAVASTSDGLAHTDSTGVLTASGFAVAVGDLAAMRGHFDHPTVTRIAFLLQEVVVDALQIDRAHQQSAHACQQQHEQQPRTPCGQGDLRGGLRDMGVIHGCPTMMPFMRT